MKKLLVILMTVCLMVGALCVIASAADPAAPADPAPGVVLRHGALKKDGTIVLAGTGVVQSFDIGPLNKAPSVTEGDPGRIVRSSSGVNVRSYPGINCDIVNKLPIDTNVIVLEQKTTYDGKVWARTMYGWISMEYIELD